MQDIPLTVPGQENTYHILVGNGTLAQAAIHLRTDQYSKIVVVSDPNVERMWLPKLTQSLQKIDGQVILPAGEPGKNLGSVMRIWSAMREAGCDRKSLVVILGGGVAGDIAAFAASTYMRGVAFAQIPTTLVGQVDSSIGGKTAIDFDNLKNLIGSFAQPTSVLVDTNTLSTLPNRDIIAGFAEMFKHALIRDADYFNKLAEKPPMDFNPDELVNLIATSIKIKADIVSKDVREAGERKLVNFGHTVGHAVEALSWETDRPLLHGEAIAMGMVVEAELSVKKKYISQEDFNHIKHVFSLAGLPIVLPPLSLDRLRDKMRRDKKNERGITLFTLLEHIGKGTYNQTVDEFVVDEIITKNMEQPSAHQILPPVGQIQ
jgi:3-dehydroquinate synthase